MISSRHVQRLLALWSLPAKTPPRVGATAADVVWQQNKAKLWAYRPSASAPPQGRPVLLVPSLINRHYILDLMPGKSLVEWLVDRGFAVYCVDWGAPGPEDADQDLDAIVDGLLRRAVAACIDHHRARTTAAGPPQTPDGDAPRGQGVHLVGYCMGGMFTAMLAARRPETAASMVAIAAPIRFRGDPGLLRAWAATDSLDLGALVQAYGVVPPWLLQGAFQLLRPTLNLSKAVHLVDRAHRPEFLDGYLAMEAWANDNVGLPGAFFRQYIEHIYRNDGLARGTLSLGGAAVDLRRLRAPTLCVVFRDDHIATADSCRALLELIGSDDKASLELSGSHVGGVVGKAAMAKLWPELASFWRRLDA